MTIIAVNKKVQPNLAGLPANENYRENCISNLNIVLELINTNHVQRFVCVEDEYKESLYNAHLIGSQTMVVFTDDTEMYISDTLDNILDKIGPIELDASLQPRPGQCSSTCGYHY